MRDFGTVRPGTTLYIPFATYDSNDPSASVTITGLAVTDVEIYKDGGTTTRASDSGYALLGTDGIDEYGTGIHGISVNLADNTTAGFYAAGSQYWVVVASVTVDAATINFIAATFRIGYQDAVLNTTIATLSTQTSFTLTAGPAEDDALNGRWCVIHDVASAVQVGTAIISDYTGSTKTVTLAAGTTFTAAATDNISIMGPMPLQPTVTARTLDVSTGGEAGVDWANVGSPTTTLNLSGTSTKAVEPTVAGRTLDVSAGGEAGLDWANIGSPTTVQGLSGTTTKDVTDVETKLGTPAGASVSADIAAIEAQTDDIGAAGAGLTAVPWNAAWDAEVQSEVDDALVAHNLDHVAGTATGIPAIPAGTYIDQMMDDGTAVYDRTTDSLQAIRDNVGTAGAGLTAIDLPDQTMNITGNITGNLSGSVGSVTGAVGSVTGNVGGDVTGSVGSVVGAVGSVTAQVTANMTSISGDTTAADNLEAATEVIVTGAAIAGTLSTTQMTTDLTEATDDHYVGLVITWRSGVLLGQSSVITSYTGSSKLLEFTAVTEAPTAGDTFVLR